MYDLTGDYTTVWWVGVGVGAFSALIHLPIREKVLVPASGMRGRDRAGPARRTGLACQPWHAHAIPDARAATWTMST